MRVGRKLGRKTAVAAANTVQWTAMKPRKQKNEQPNSCTHNPKVARSNPALFASGRDNFGGRSIQRRLSSANPTIGLFRTGLNGLVDVSPGALRSLT